MSRILDRATGSHTGAGVVRPRLPMLFEPGLDVMGWHAAGPADSDPGEPSRWQDGPAGAPAFPGEPVRHGEPEPALSGEPVPSAGPGPTAPDPGFTSPTSPARSWQPMQAADQAKLGMPTASTPLWGVPPTRGSAQRAARPVTGPPVSPAGPRPAGPRSGDDPATAGRPGFRQSHPVRLSHAPAGTRATSAVRWTDFPADGIRPAGGIAVPWTSSGQPGGFGQEPEDGLGGDAAARRSSAASPAPVVRIEIGRVEIRANHSAALSRPERPGVRRYPAPDLAKYLEKRGGRP